LRHGLAVSVLKDFAMSAEVERLAHAIMRQAGALVRLDQARIIAEAELELSRVRATRIALVQAKERDLREADSEQLPAADLFDSIPLFEQRRARAFMEALPELGRLDRYERRALSRRKRAIRTLNQP
jgi:hypothetical protein